MSRRAQLRNPSIAVGFWTARRLVYTVMLFWGLEQLHDALTTVSADTTFLRQWWWWLARMVNGVWLFRFGVTGVVKDTDDIQARSLGRWTGVWWCLGLTAVWQDWQIAPPLYMARQAIALHALEITGLFAAVQVAVGWLRQTRTLHAPAIWLAVLTHLTPAALVPQQVSTLIMSVSQHAPVPAVIWPMTAAGVLLVTSVALVLMGRSPTACVLAMLALLAHLTSRVWMDLIQLTTTASGAGNAWAVIVHLVYVCAAAGLMIALLRRTQRMY